MKPRAWRRTLGVAAVVLATAVVAPFALAELGENHPAASIGAGFIQLNETHLLTPNLVRAFVPTKSASQRCLVTFAESSGGTDGSTVYCGARSVNGVEGVLITIILRDSLTDLGLSMTVYQQFAKEYGAPVVYTGD